MTNNEGHPMTKDSKSTFPFLQNGITQVGWVVENIDEAVNKFYDYTGIGPWHFYMYGPELLHVMKRNGVDTKYNMATAVTNAGPLRLEFIQPLSGSMVYDEYIDKYGYGGVQHFGIAVENIKKSLEIVRNAGISITMEGGGYGVDGDGYFAYLDTVDLFGIVIELMERPRRRHIPYKIYP